MPKKYIKILGENNVVLITFDSSVLSNDDYSIAEFILKCDHPPRADQKIELKEVKNIME